VLQRYYDKPRIYTVGSGGVSCLDLWDIPFGVNDEGLIHVWLGDLGRIPYEEQQHWRLYNVQPSGGLEEAFTRRQLFAEFAESKDPIDLLHRAREQTNEKFERRFGFRLFRELAEEDSYVKKSIHLPTTREQKEVDEQLVYLAKYLVDSIDKRELEVRVLWKPPIPAEGTHTRFLDAFLIEIVKMEPSNAKRAVEPLRVLQALRSMSAAHPKSREYHRELEKIGFARLRPKMVIEKIIDLITSSLSLIQHEILPEK